MLFYYWLALMLPMPDHWLWAYQIGPLDVIKCVGLACLGAAMFRLTATRSLPPFYRRPEVWCCLAYLFVAFVSYSVRDLADLGFPGMAKLLAVLSLLIVTLILVDTEHRFRRVIFCVVAGQAICSLYAIRQWFQFRYAYSGFRSFGGLTDDANYFAIAVVLWLPVTFLWIRGGKSRLERLFCLGCALTMLVGFLISGSRGGLLGLVLGCVLMIWRSKNRLRNLFLTAILGLAMVAVSLFSSSSAVSRLAHPSASDIQSSQARLDLWKVGLGVVSAHPLFGVGAQAWEAALSYHEHFNVSHNTYLDVLGQLGFAGFLPFLGILIFTYHRLGVLAKSAEDVAPELRRAATGFQAGIAGYAVAAFFLSTWWQEVLWLVVFLSMRIGWLPTESGNGAEAGAGVRFKTTHPSDSHTA